MEGEGGGLVQWGGYKRELAGQNLVEGFISSKC